VRTPKTLGKTIVVGSRHRPPPTMWGVIMPMRKRRAIRRQGVGVVDGLVASTHAVLSWRLQTQRPGGIDSAAEQ
jgi:hypothetical protein